MMDKKNIDKYVDDGLNYIQQLDTIELDDFFDIRVQARIKELESESRGPLPFYRRAPSMAFIIMLLAVNLLSIVYFSDLFLPKGPVITPPPVTAPVTAPVNVTTAAEAMGAAYGLEQNTHDIALINRMKQKKDGK